MKLNEFIKNFFEKVKNDVVELAETELTNENKKLMLDHNIVNWLEKAISGLTINLFLKMALKKLLLPNVSLITQLLFDFLKAKIQGVTK